MIAPELRVGSNRETGRLLLLRNNLLASALIFLGLEFWRPYFFLTDDNLDGGLPFFTEVGRHLLAGRSPFYSDYLFGGHYNLLRDTGFFEWHPLYLLVSLLAESPLRLMMIDLDAFALFMLATAGFVNLAWYLRRELSLTISDGWIMFYTLSFTYSMIALTTGASWLTFLGNQSALPWLVLGILQRSWWRGAGLVALFSLHQILGGHPEPTISTTLFLTLFAAGLSYAHRSLRPLGCWAIGFAVAALIALPLLLPVLSGFSTSARSHGVELSDMGANNIPMRLFPTSIFFGVALALVHPGIHPHTTYTLALGGSAAVWCFGSALAGTKRWHALERITFVLLIFIAVLICRPVVISEIMLRLPMLRSMRWPFRELLQFQFFMHLFLVVRPPGFRRGLRRGIAIFSLLLYVCPLLFALSPPTFNGMIMDRQLILSGEFNDYWKKVRPLLKPTDRITAIIPLNVYFDGRFEEPYSLLSIYDYPCLDKIVGVWGWSQAAPADQLYVHTQPVYPFGAFVPEQKAALLAERPDLKFLTLESLQPLKITLSSRTGPTVDLTPFVPADIRAYANALPLQKKTHSP